MLFGKIGRDNCWHDSRRSEAALKTKAIIAIGAALLLWGCGKPRPKHSYVFDGYTTENGERAYVFESDEMEGNTHVHYITTCDGHVSNAGEDGDCRAIARYLHRMLPPTYYTTHDGGEHAYLEIPSLNLEFTVEEAD